MVMAVATQTRSAKGIGHHAGHLAGLQLAQVALVDLADQLHRALQRQRLESACADAETALATASRHALDLDRRLEVLQRLQDSIWPPASALEANAASWQRNLQREHTQRLAASVLRPIFPQANPRLRASPIASMEPSWCAVLPAMLTEHVAAATRC